jgi:hypothetical protein
MSKVSWKSKTATLLGTLILASSGALIPAPALAYPTCEDLFRQQCRRYFEGQPSWQAAGYPSQEACVMEYVELYCPDPYQGPF